MAEIERRSGCGVQGCLFGAVALFALLLIAILVIAVIRFSEPPQGQRMPPGQMPPPGQTPGPDRSSLEVPAPVFALTLPPGAAGGDPHG